MLESWQADGWSQLPGLWPGLATVELSLCEVSLPVRVDGTAANFRMSVSRASRTEVRRRQKLLGATGASVRRVF
eukprot:709414-Hanusia_phi.AAC.1